MSSQAPLKDDLLPHSALQKAAAYVRMSTDEQQYSIESQIQAILIYARAHSIIVVRTYADEGRSGLTIERRDALQQLLADVREGRADFTLILVYDVSRWGRFQDIDESAHYEFICKRAGVRVEYCAEGFRNDGSLVATLIKGLKRSMAGEFSRELSAKVVASHLRMAQRGFHQGGLASFGLRRAILDREGRPKQILAAGEAKALHHERVVLVPGPIREIRTVREIFRLYVEEGLAQNRIARNLNQLKLRNSCGNAWSEHTVRRVLRNERYIGNLVYNRTSIKLGGRRISNPRDAWVRRDAVIEPIVDPKIFALAQLRLNTGWAINDADLLNHLTAVWCVTGQLSTADMKSVANTPAPTTYQSRFGGLGEAYRLIGYRRTRSYRAVGLEAVLRRTDRYLIDQLGMEIRRREVPVRFDLVKPILYVGDTTIATIVLPYRPKGRLGRAGWWLQLKRVARCDVMLVARLTRTNTQLLDCHVFPFPVLSGPSYRFARDDMPHLARYRLSAMSNFWSVYDDCIARPRGLAYG